MGDQQEREETVCRLHSTPPVVLPNARDALGGRAKEEAGARAIAGTSGVMTWAHGEPDGQGLAG